MHFDPEAADSSGVIDPFVRFKFGKGCEWRDTATHYRALNGEAFFNWRFTFPVTLDTVRTSAEGS